MNSGNECILVHTKAKAEALREIFHMSGHQNADSLLTSVCEQRAATLYGEPLPDFVRERLESELESIRKQDKAAFFLLLEKLKKELRKAGHMCTGDHLAGAALVSYLCGITAYNPLPAHYCCTCCHHTEPAEDKAAGIDLPDKNCPICGKAMKKDGFQLLVETLFGDDGTKAVLSASLACEADLGQWIEKWMQEMTQGEWVMYRAHDKLLGGQAVMLRVLFADDGKYENMTREELRAKAMSFELHGNPMLSVLKALEQKTGVQVEEISLKDSEVMSLFHSGGVSESTKPANKNGKGFGFLEITALEEYSSFRMLERYEWSSAEELIRLIALGESEWETEAEEQFRMGANLQDCVSYRDNIMEYLVAKGMSRADAFQIMERARKGKGLRPAMEQAMKDAGVPAWYIRACDSAWYLTTKANAVDLLNRLCYLVYFKRRYPEAFYEVVRKY